MERELNILCNQNSHENRGSSQNHQHVITVTEEERDWLASVEARINTSPKFLNKSAGSETCCIFRVPKSLVEINEKAYQPQIVSLGPYHHGDDHLKVIQEHKWRYLRSTLSRTKPDVDFKVLYAAIAAMEQKIRESYSESIEFSSRELIEMMVLDGCFIIELFRIVGRSVAGEIDDPIFSMSWVFPFLNRDLLILENQIPYFVLQRLFDLTVRESPPTLSSLALKFFNYMVQRDLKILEEFYNLEAKHLLDLFRLSLIPASKEKAREASPFLHLIPSAKKLHIAGMKFKPREATTFLDVKFRKGILEIPKFTIDDFTSSVILNLVAYEQCYCHCSKHTTTYVILMGCLINTPADAGYLNDHKVIENYFGTDEEVARFFNVVCKDVAFDIRRSYLSELLEDVNKYYKNDLNVHWASFKHTYFDSPWSFLSAMAALILLFLTMIQSLFAVYSYMRPRK